MVPFVHSNIILICNHPINDYRYMGGGGWVGGSNACLCVLDINVWECSMCVTALPNH